jgi:quinol monooxygenase YgiN
MSVTVVTRWRARPRQAEELVTTALRVTARPSAKPVFLRSAPLFQELQDPSVILMVDEWRSRDIVPVDGPFGNALQALDDLSVEPRQYTFFKRLALYEDLSQSPVVVACALVETPCWARAAVQAFLLADARQTIRDYPGLVLHHVYQDQDDHTRFFVLHGWTSRTALAQFRGAAGPALSARMRGLGATSVVQFVGRSLMDLGVVTRAL